jgi:ABC-2 type transport system ATP-binding protein
MKRRRSRQIHAEVPANVDMMIEAAGIRKAFGPTQALAGMDLAADCGKVLGLLGPNGAGKTTFVRIISTLLTPDAGWAKIAGLDVVRDGRRVRSLIGLAGQYAAVDENLTGRENLELVGRLYHLGKKERRTRAADVLALFSLTDAAGRQVKTYSGGMRRRLDVGASLVGRPALLILDEPTTGLDPRSRIDVWEFLRDLVVDGTTVLLTTQYLEEADALAHKIVVLDEGKVIAEGTSDELKDQLGGDRVEARVAGAEQLETVRTILAELGDGPPHTDYLQNRVSVPSRQGARTLIAAARRMADAGVDLDDLSVRRPSLDDVFLALTGHAAGGDGGDARGGAARGGGGARPGDAAGGGGESVAGGDGSATKGRQR